MKKLVLMMAILLVGGVAHAKKNCTDQPKDKWMKEEDLKKRLEGKATKFENSNSQEPVTRFMEPIKTEKTWKSISIPSMVRL
jgi:hypothetical protein